MTDPVVALEPTDLTVEPGGQIRAEITVRNPGTVVEGYRIEVLGETPDQGPPAWAQVYPAELRVFPKESGTATLVFAPPTASASAGGRFAFGVRVASTLETERSAVAEGDLEVGRVFGLQATMTPTTSTGRWRGYHVIRYTNWGNTAARLRVTASDPDERLGFFLRPDEVDLPLGGKAEVRLTVRTRKPFLRGPQTRLPFEVVGEQDGVPRQQPAHPMVSDPSRPVANGALMQKPVLSKAVVVLAMACVAVLAGALVLAFKQPKKAAQFGTGSAPLPPTGVAAARVRNGIELSWSAPQNVSGYQLRVTGGPVPIPPTPIPADQQRFVTTALGLAPATRYCFALESLRGSRVSAFTAPICKVTPAAPKSSTSGSKSASGSGAASSTPGGGNASGSSSPSGSSSGLPPPKLAAGDWILLCFPLRYDDQPKAEATARADAAKITFHTPVDVLHTTDYPGFTVDGSPAKTRPFWAVFSGPYTSATETVAQSKADLLAQNNITCKFVKPLGG